MANGQLISQTRNTVTHFYLQDGQHSVRALADTAGTVTDTYDYTAFGEIYAQTGTTENPYRFAGQQFDTETDLYSMRARYYAPADGRFLTRDTYPYNYQNPVELNRYGYAANNPINGYDPTGLFFVETGSSHRASVQQAEAVTLVGTAIKNITIVVPVKQALIALLLVGFPFLQIILYPDIWPYPPPHTGPQIPPVTPQTYPYTGPQLGPVPTPPLNPATPPLLQTPPQINPYPDVAPQPVPEPPTETQPQPEPTPDPTDGPPDDCPEGQDCEDGNTCDAIAFTAWWFSKPPVQSSMRPGIPDYEYEQRVARASGNLGNYTRRFPALALTIDVDGIDPSRCLLIEAKLTNSRFYQDYEALEDWYKNASRGGHVNLISELVRYRAAVSTPNGIPGAQPKGLLVRVSNSKAVKFFEKMLSLTGFTLGKNGFVEHVPS